MYEFEVALRAVLGRFRNFRPNEAGDRCLTAAELARNWTPDFQDVLVAAVTTLIERGLLDEVNPGLFCLTEKGKASVEALGKLS